MAHDNDILKPNDPASLLRGGLRKERAKNLKLIALAEFAMTRIHPAFAAEYRSRFAAAIKENR